MIKAERRQNKEMLELVMMVMEVKVTRIKITGIRKEKLGLEKRKKEKEDMRLGNKSGTFLLYTLNGNNNYEILIIPLRKI